MPGERRGALVEVLGARLHRSAVPTSAVRPRPRLHSRHHDNCREQRRRAGSDRSPPAARHLCHHEENRVVRNCRAPCSCIPPQRSVGRRVPAPHCRGGAAPAPLHCCRRVARERLLTARLAVPVTLQSLIAAARSWSAAQSGSQTHGSVAGVSAPGTGGRGSGPGHTGRR